MSTKIFLTYALLLPVTPCVFQKLITFLITFFYKIYLPFENRHFLCPQTPNKKPSRTLIEAHRAVSYPIAVSFHLYHFQSPL